MYQPMPCGSSNSKTREKVVASYLINNKYQKVKLKKSINIRTW